MESQSSGRCAQCSDTRNLYIKTCQCSKEASFTPEPVSGKGCVQSDSKKATSITVDTKKESTTDESSRFKAVKAVVHKVIKVYESRSPNTMKYITVVSALILFFGILSLVLAQRDETAQQSKYGMAFALGESAAASDEKRVAVGVPGEEQQPTASSNEAVTTTAPSSSSAASSEDITVPATTAPDTASQNKPESSDNQNEEVNPAILIAGDDDEKHEEGDQNPRIVFIERLMGLHVSAPANRGEGQPNEPPRDSSNEQNPNSIRNPMDKVNAKWASRMRKFSIPIPQQTDAQPNLMQPPVQEHPMLRYAAAAMMSRLVAAAARAQMEAQAREAMLARAKDKDDENEDGTVPVIVATVRDNQQQGPQVRPLPPMYGRPMPRPQMVRHPIIPYNVVQQQPRQLPSMPHRAFIAPPQRPPMAPTIQRRVAPPPQPVLLMVAVPLQQSSESRQSPVHINPMISQRPAMPFYPSVPYNIPLIYRHQPQPASTFAMPVQIPVPAHFQTPYLQRPVINYPMQQKQIAAFSHVRPVVEVPVEVPVPYHFPVPIAVRQFNQQNNDQDASGSDADHMILLYDAEIQHEEGDDLDSSASEGHEQIRGPKGHHFLGRPLPQTASPNKLKLWRELAGAKYAAQSGVRYIPVAVATSDEPAAANSHFAARNGFQQRLHAQESIGQPAFIVLAEPESH